jgi:gamma-glutamyltranspeptidase
VEDGSVRLEEGLWDRAQELAEQGFQVVKSGGQTEFGGGQAILIEENHLLGASDARRDGFAAGF